MSREIKFEHITIKPIVRRRKYVAEFIITYPFRTETTIGGNSPEECLSKTENLLDVKLTTEQYTIMP